MLTRDYDLTEIIDGVEVMGPSPFMKHQDISSNLYGIIWNYVKANGLGKVFYSPLDIIFEEGVNRLQPDILFIKKENMTILQDWIRGVPDMVCEIVSQGTFRKDTETKKAIYEKYKVPEYWIVVPEFLTIEIFTMENDKYKLNSAAEIEGTVTSKVIEGLKVNIEDIFER
ncbi:MAG: Uma2 family endonuclease [Nitrospirota bacterium]